MEKIDVGLQDTLKLTNKLLKFPRLIKKRGVLEICFKNIPSQEDNRYYLELYEITKSGKAVMRHKTQGQWRRNYSIAYDTSRDFYAVAERQYILLIKFYVLNNIEVKEYVYIDRI